VAEGKDISAWVDDNGEFILVGNEYCKEGDTLIAIPATQDSVIAWMRVLLELLADGDPCDLPGELTTCASAKEV
jgi:hypothetical protein